MYWIKKGSKASKQKNFQLFYPTEKRRKRERRGGVNNIMCVLYQEITSIGKKFLRLKRVAITCVLWYKRKEIRVFQRGCKYGKLKLSKIICLVFSLVLVLPTYTTTHTSFFGIKSPCICIHYITMLTKMHFFAIYCITSFLRCLLSCIHVAYLTTQQ